MKEPDKRMVREVGEMEAFSVAYRPFSCGSEWRLWMGVGTLPYLYGKEKEAQMVANLLRESADVSIVRVRLTIVGEED